MDKIPSEDREQLNIFFHFIMNHDHFSYTLFGDKAVSVSGDFIITPLQNIRSRMRCGSIFWNRWKIWQKYAHHFPFNRYLLIQENHPYQQVGSIFFINKKAFVHQVNRYITIFKNVLGSGVTGEDLLKQIEQQQRFTPSIKNNIMLLGILLGYGPHNAQFFERRDQLFLFIIDESIPNQERLPRLPFKQPLPSLGFSSIEEEYQFLKAHLKPFNQHHYSPIIIKPIHFLADPEDPETKFLKQKYQNLLSQISTVYAKGDFLEITLSQLISP